MRREAVLLLAGTFLAFASSANAGAPTKCRLKYDLKGWSVFYKTAKGSGRISCDNGQSANVSLEAQGGGLTFGKTEITGGEGDFSGVDDIAELFGTYVEATAHAGAGASTDARVMTRGDVSLSLSGTGRGTNLGIAFGGFTIRRR